ncbi:MAG: alpha/beta fold hydrolase, partial [Actinomycetota bacterium]|nr:alpha/beta fold hydrolase [Actinomycetota bacterium]
MRRSSISIATLVIMAAVLVLPLSVAAAGNVRAAQEFTPIVFVHGSFGSATQFESQALRFASNGYPADLISAYDYDTSVSLDDNQAEVLAGLDAHIDAVLAATGADKVYALGHSRGTRVMHLYLADAGHAAKVAKYVNIDGQTSAAPPGGVSTLALWAGTGTPGREITGATNVTIPDQTHVQVASSPESFLEMYRFFTSEEAATSNILPEPQDQVKIAGRAVYFPQNTGVAGGTLQMWEVDRATGRRIKEEPEQSIVLGADGAWGPWSALGGHSYEFVILREGFRPHHFYSEPLIRSDYLVRLNTSPAGGIADLLTQGDAHSVLVLTRDKEFFANEPGNSDTLRVNGTTLVGEDACPIERSKVAIFVYDSPADGSIPGTPDGISDITEPNWIHAISFLTGIDFVIPAADPPDETISVELAPRGGGAAQVVNCPNFASSQQAISIRFNDFPYDYNTMWYLAEGATAGDFETWVLVQNPGTEAVTVDLTFMTGSGPVAGPQDVEIAGGSRMSFNADLYVTDYDVSTKVEATGAVICERAVYGGNRTWAHDSIG